MLTRLSAILILSLNGLLAKAFWYSSAEYVQTQLTSDGLVDEHCNSITKINETHRYLLATHRQNELRQQLQILPVRRSETRVTGYEKNGYNSGLGRPLARLTCSRFGLYRKMKKFRGRLFGNTSSSFPV